MTDYIEDTVRDRFILGHPAWEREIQGEEHIGRDFDRWLKKVKADVWDEAYDSGMGDEAHYARGLSTDPGADDVPHENPYL